MALTVTKFDQRRHANNSFPVARSSVYTFTISATTASVNVVDNINGKLLGVIYTCPNLTTDTTFQLDILDSDGAVLFTKNDLPDNSPTTPNVVWMSATEIAYLVGDLTLKITITTSQSATIKMALIYT